MPYVAPSTVVAGQTYSAANHNIIVNDIIDHEDRLDTVQNAQYPARNVLVNGAMQFAQRGTSTASITTSNYYTADRWKTDITTLGTWTQSVEADGPTGSGLTKSLKMLCTTADASPAAGDLLNVAQLLEGQTLQHIKKGTSSAQQLSLSFWVKSNVTGTYIAFLYDSDNNRSVSASYTINASATWEQKTITFPADTTGTLNNDNAQSLELYMCLAAGSDFTSGSLGTTWGSYVAANRAVGQVNLASAVNNYWQITGVQLEPGAQASPFEFVRYDDELARCQRYYTKSYDYATIPGTSTTDGVYLGSANTNVPYGQGPYIAFKVTMRDTPVVTLYSEGGVSGQARWDRTGAGAETVTTSANSANSNGFSPGTTALTQSRMNVRGHYVASAEL